MINNQSNDYIKPTIETRVIKMQDGTDFVLEYPSNYKNIADKKLAKLESEYEETIKANIPSLVNDDKSKSNSNEEKNHTSVETHKENKVDSTVNTDIVKDNEEKANEEKESNKAGGSQQFGEYNQLNDEEEFIEVKEDDEVNHDSNNKEDMIKDEKFQDQPVSIIKETNTHCKDKNIHNQDPDMNNFEFLGESISNKQETKRKCSPIKNPEKIKQTMRSIKIKPPKWAENLSDEDFIKRAKQFLSKNQ